MTIPLRQWLALLSRGVAAVATLLLAAVLFALGAAITRTPLTVAPITLVAWQVEPGCVAMVISGIADRASGHHGTQHRGLGRADLHDPGTEGGCLLSGVVRDAASFAA
ncbi:hypothetical protein [Paraburkholderia sp. RAU2J]|uniref:hypothetical protein n=1 Tax=Paraburkholderia sp. RAU2J TaxID=1938810 RepID=UPI0011C48ADF|nr:hypothetical protein [Paraburkholderia sp. RAU2J]